MKLDTSRDIEAPIEFVFGQMSDFKAIERAAMRRGAEVQRTDDLTRTGPGMTWDANFELRGRMREIHLELTEYAPPERMLFATRSPSLSGHFVVELVALSPGSTRAAVAVEMQPDTLSGKLLVQSMKLARKTLTRRMKDRMATRAEEIEQRYRRGA